MEKRSRSYLQLMKPGITLSNSIAAVAGFFLALSQAPASITTFIGAIGGTALLIASGCVVNNILDRNIDKRMKRTKKRALLNGDISVAKAAIYAAVLGLVGFALLLFWTNTVTLILGATAYIWYVVVYGLAKRTTILSTLIGGVAGALPPAAGYTAVTGHFDTGALILFLILFIWQMPHFYAIAIFRRDDYKKAKLPIWSVSAGIESTKRQILAFAILYGLATPLLFIYGYTGYIYLIISVGLSVYWIIKGIQGYRTQAPEKWARKMFGISLLQLLNMCALIALGGFLP